MSAKDTFIKPLVSENPVTLHVLGICSALAITNSLTSSLIMSVSLTSVLVITNIAISLIRKHLPSSVRLIVQITIIASAVAVIDQVLTAYLPDAAKTLSVYVALIVTNCIVLGRAEACAMKCGVGTSILDALGNGLGYSIILIVVSVIRELFGNGSLMGYKILELVQDGGLYQPNAMLMLPPSAFFIIGFLVWVIRSWKPEQNENADFKPTPLPDREKR
ncbi:MAG: NADH:ubiquinone reductase (Na(+)-transporting) subunit D [Xanthomonadales bacterium]|nr:NADH:ubiquinone reductase (Na(+)-transporting) subunit D [Gammaproteobacteria bacterium]MBT8055180.1 NADH:ubiquinone reductase (Na(+)-transporting) subunit D [Gammaproteobacteria bacterium]NND55824.1 NADH:ubiquinone reductase (Na(+)-transporting) subunit D [Xanthomonadales bacterium]NNK51367.1 NADH:ubiquinone reductase (Na(+)-transporting) subunit D [Xanthomonadales bacterium]